jgi:hypothetical protein
METSASPASARHLPRRRFYFSLGALLLLVFCFAAVFAGYRAGFDQGYMSGVRQYAVEHPYSKVYPVADLVSPVTTSKDFDELIDLITNTIQPASWDPAGGAGSITAFESNLSLVIHQTDEVHKQTEKLLEQLRTLRKNVAKK